MFHPIYQPLRLFFLNCPSSNTGTSFFVVRNERNHVAAVGWAGITSCEHFLKLCFNATIPIMNKFTLQPGNPQADIYIAEIVLYINGVCNTSNSLVSINDTSTEAPRELNISLLYINRKKKCPKISASQLYFFTYTNFSFKFFFLFLHSSACSQSKIVKFL